MEDWLLALSPKAAFTICLELLVCAIHPIPGDITLKWSSRDIQNDEKASVDVPLDIVLSIPMFLRVYLLCRLLSHPKTYCFRSHTSDRM